MSLLQRLAATAPPPVFACIGPDMLPAVERLFAARGLRRALSPRHAAVLLVAGDAEAAAPQALERVHDQVPAPRATLAWDGRSDPLPDLVAGWRRAISGAGEPDRLPDRPPNPWRGRGDHGQGGEGMMGGTPYGRPMAMPDEDLRDGLSLDAYTARLGPFAPMLPPGLQLDLTLQGDVVVAASVCAPPFAQPAEASDPAPCAARLLRLIGLDRAADRLPRAGPRRLPFGAPPRGLGAVAGAGDVRSRLADWLSGRRAGDAAPPLPTLLVGAEWHEAVLCLASFTPDALRAACLPERAA